MWYYDPFIMSALTFGFVGGFAAACGSWAASRRRSFIAKFFMLCLALSLGGATFTLVFGWLLNNGEVFQSWISTTL